MALNHGFAAGAAMVNSFLGLPAPVHRAARAIDHVVFPRQANGTSDTPTINLFIDSGGADVEWAASIVSACSDQTVFAARCTRGPSDDSGYGAISFPCGINAPAVTFTQGPSTYVVETDISTRTLGVAASVSLLEACSLQGTTAAACDVSLSISASGTTLTTSTETTIRGTSYRRYDVAITGGASKTAAAATAACSANSGGGSGSGAGTGGSESSSSSGTTPTPTGAASALQANALHIGAIAGAVGLVGLLAL